MYMVIGYSRIDCITGTATPEDLKENVGPKHATALLPGGRLLWILQAPNQLKTAKNSYASKLMPYQGEVRGVAVVTGYALGRAAALTQEQVTQTYRDMGIRRR